MKIKVLKDYREHNPVDKINRYINKKVRYKHKDYNEEYHIHLQIISDIQMTHYRLDINVILFDNIYFANSSLNSCLVIFQENIYQLVL